MNVEHFDAKYQRDPDPWGYRHSWYEQRKYAITVACLPRPRYHLVWEPACSIGVLTGLLAERAGRVLASDASATAISLARDGAVPDGSSDSARTADIDWAVMTLPGPLPAPAGSADLVVLSEILYYLPDTDRGKVLDDAHDLLEPGGDLVVVHWRSRAEDTYLSGDDANAWVRARPAWSSLLTHVDEHFVLDVLRRR
jgi:SAM-dependent methyltransferase